MQTDQLSPGPASVRAFVVSGVAMADAWRDLGGRRRTLARQVYARDKATPGYVCPGAPGRPCSQSIEWTLPYKDAHGQVNVWSKSVDHGVELQDGGDLTDLGNLWSAHLGCNSSKGASRRWERTRPARGTAMVISLDVSAL